MGFVSNGPSQSVVLPLPSGLQKLRFIRRSLTHQLHLEEPRRGEGDGGRSPGIFQFLVFAPVFYHAPNFTIDFEELVQEILLHKSFAPTFIFIFLVNWNLGRVGGGGKEHFSNVVIDILGYLLHILYTHWVSSIPILCKVFIEVCIKQMRIPPKFWFFFPQMSQFDSLITKTKN